ncbi:MAG: serine/threonine protein phosphatase, partial [Deltaproteobacteria bacterium]|nr:serine/threonine protein phosphatase [Deltaproteobacteria bacterium]
MLTFSDDPRAAEQQMQAIIWYMTAIGHLDGDFDESEREYVRDHVAQLVIRRANAALAHDPDLHASVVEKWTAHFHEVADGVAAEVGAYFTESVAEGENTDQFVTAKLKLRCFELFQRFDAPGRRQLLTVADAMIEADGVVHPAEA